jgi:hypothetical protein
VGSATDRFARQALHSAAVGPPSSRGPGRHPFKVEIRGSNPLGGTKPGTQTGVGRKAGPFFVRWKLTEASPWGREPFPRAGQRIVTWRAVVRLMLSAATADWMTAGSQVYVPDVTIRAK